MTSYPTKNKDEWAVPMGNSPAPVDEGFIRAESGQVVLQYRESMLRILLRDRDLVMDTLAEAFDRAEALEAEFEVHPS